MNKKFLIFSGHNDRAAIALCRYFHDNKVDFVVAARLEGDVIRNSIYRDRIIFDRQTPIVDLQLFANIAAVEKDTQLIYCPTTEFINLFLLENRSDVEGLGYIIPLPNAELYLEVTNKKSAGRFFSSVPGIILPEEFQVDQAAAPCVLKPFENQRNGKILYPHICMNDSELQQFFDTQEVSAYFAQEFVSGSSLYLCGCIDDSDSVDCFWQRNIAQQPNGKSIVLAREEPNVSADLSDLKNALVHHLRKSGFRGPFMIEIRRSGTENYFIEINPRFWGPLQLSVDACPSILERFVRMSLHNFNGGARRKSKMPCYYAWKGGMTEWSPLEGAAELEAAQAVRDIWDVFEREDYNDIGLR